MKINVRQICFILVIYTVASKLLMYPTLLANSVEGNTLLPALINFAVSGAVIWSLSYLCSKTDKTFFELLQGTIGNVGARIVFGLFAVYFLFMALLPIFEQKQYIHAIFYDTVPSLGVFMPFFLLSAYVAGKKFTNTGRCADILFPIFLSLFAFLLIMATTEVQWDNILPAFEIPASQIFGASAGSAFSFTEPCWLLMFMGRFKYKKHDALKITLSYVAGAVLVLLFLTEFFGVYGAISPSRTFAVSRISLFFPAMDMLGRIDLILLYGLEVVQLFALILNIQLAVYAISECSGYKNTMIISTVVNGVFAVILLFCNHYYNAIYEIYFRWMWIAVLVFAVAIPLLAWTLKRRKYETR